MVNLSFDINEYNEGIFKRETHGNSFEDPYII